MALLAVDTVCGFPPTSSCLLCIIELLARSFFIQFHLSNFIAGSASVHFGSFHISLSPLLYFEPALPPFLLLLLLLLLFLLFFFFFCFRPRRGQALVTSRTVVLPNIVSLFFWTFFIYLFILFYLPYFLVTSERVCLRERVRDSER